MSSDRWQAIQRGSGAGVQLRGRVPEHGTEVRAGAGARRQRRDVQGGPGGGAAPHVVVVPAGAVRDGAEPGALVRVEGQPRAGEVGRGVPGADVPEVDETGQPTVPILKALSRATKAAEEDSVRP